jgi:diguanylate cyclase (GGDEF)-like protein
LKNTIEYANRYEEFFAVALIGLDDFKRINDTYGHSIGDNLLKNISSKLIDTLRDSDYIARISDEDDLIARMGGDEFMILLHAIVDIKNINQVVKRIHSQLSKVYEISGREIFISVSIGISKFPEDGEDAETLIKNADSALHYAKNEGKNRYQFYSQSMNEAVTELLNIEIDLQKALKEKELLLYYQPKIDISTKKIIGMEALIRWKRSGGNFISPAKFIPIAETNGLIIPISDFVLRTACLQNKMWHEAGLEKIKVAVNVSGYQFGQKDLVNDTLKALDDIVFDPQYLELEITETSIMKNPESAVKKLSKLREMGIHISIDDFGTGYSSLNYLQRLPLDSLKIDISFIRNVLSNPNDATIVKTIIAMAHNLGLEVIAEGVENEHQLSFLEEHECDIVQGYFFSPPVPAEDFLSLFTEWNDQTL